MRLIAISTQVNIAPPDWLGGEFAAILIDGLLPIFLLALIWLVLYAIRPRWGGECVARLIRRYRWVMIWGWALLACSVALCLAEPMVSRGGCLDGHDMEAPDPIWFYSFGLPAIMIILYGWAHKIRLMRMESAGMRLSTPSIFWQSWAAVYAVFIMALGWGCLLLIFFLASNIFRYVP